MSVINTMLKKLDERGAPGAAASPGSVGAAPAPKAAATASRWRLPAIVVLGGGAIAAAAFGDWPNTLQSANARPAAPSVAVPQAPDAGVAEAAAAAPASVPVASVEAAPKTTSTAWPARTLAAAQPTPAAPRARTAEPAEALPLPPSLEAGVTLPSRIDKRPLAQTPSQRAQGLYRSAVEAAQAGQRRTGLERAQEALAVDPRHAAARLLAAVLEHEGGASERAALLLREGLTLDPQQPQQALLLARVLVQQGDTAGALAVLDQYAVAGAEAAGLRGGILARQGDFARSLGAFESAARQQPGNPMWWLGLGVALDSEGQAPRARQAYARAQAIGLPRDDLASYVDQRLRALE